MDSDLSALAEQIAKNSEEARRLQHLFQLKQARQSTPTVVANQGASISQGGSLPTAHAVQRALLMEKNKHITANTTNTSNSSGTVPGQGQGSIKNVGPSPRLRPNLHTTPPTAQPTPNPGGTPGQGAGAGAHARRPDDRQTAARSAAEQRARARESAKVARERRERAWVSATRSLECIKKNVDRFQKEDENLEKPYPELDADLEIADLDEEVRESFKALRKDNPVDETKKSVKFTLNSKMLRNRLAYLRDHAFILYTVDILPSRDVVVDWTEVILKQQLGINVTRVRVLNKHCFLITVDDKVDSDDILLATPLYLGGNHMVFALPWTPLFNPADISSSKVPVWVELPHVFPGVEAFGEQLLSQIGEVLHTNTRHEDCKFHSVKGCLLLDLREELPESIEIEDEVTMESYHQKIVYSSMPDACFFCHQRGHTIRNCQERRNRRGNQVQTQGRADQATAGPEKNTGNNRELFQTVRGRKSNREVSKQVATPNPYDALNNLQEDDLSSDDEDNTAEATTAVQVPLVAAPTPGLTFDNHTLKTGINTHQTSSSNSAGEMEIETDPAKLKRTRDEAEKIDTPLGAQAAVGKGNVLQKQRNRRRLTKVKTWVKQQGSDLAAIMIQEMRIKEELTTRRLFELAESDNFVVDYTNEGKAGAAVVLLRPDWQIILRGMKGDGTLTWMQVRTEKGILGLASVHGPRDRTSRKRLWESMENTWDPGTWILSGDWNSVETPADSEGDSPIQHGGEWRKWQSFLAHQDLKDGWIEAASRTGPHFTREQMVNGRHDKARLDRIYYSKCEHLTGLVLKAKHDETIKLSDHKPVLLHFQKWEIGQKRRSTYFKPPPDLLTDPAIIREIKAIWNTTCDVGEDPRRRWDRNWGGGGKKEADAEDQGAPGRAVEGSGKD
ncbi:hypothetical protein R1sor_012552 [Riccia sorocarpa]|uniref:CCHC-type domain-containing protein n=1 Tax=Riccia sorocarpa TaxID=122646 RepID=A0ABD3I5A5_9MARC